ncbi:MAG: archaellin/type IV pilin N-terminal domain-containing protein [Thermofilum sp.]
MRRKGISPVIATLLLIVIAVVAAVLTYIWVTGYMGTLSPREVPG